MAHKIYEIIDTSDDEMYFPLGIFLSLDAAMKAIEDCGDGRISEQAEEFEEIKIMERDEGWSDNGKEAFVMNREIYEDENGEDRCRPVNN